MCVKAWCLGVRVWGSRRVHGSVLRVAGVCYPAGMLVYPFILL